MGLLTDVLLFPITGPVRGLHFVLEKIQDQVDAEMLDEGRVERELIDLHLRYDLGEISDADFALRETELLDELNASHVYNDAFSDFYNPVRDADYRGDLDTTDMEVERK